MQAGAPPLSAEVKPSAPIVTQRPLVPDLGSAAAKLLEAGLNFLESISPPRPDTAGTADRLQPLERAVAALCRIDTQTQRPMLAIPLPESFTAERLAGAISGLLSKIASSA